MTETKELQHDAGIGPSAGQHRRITPTFDRENPVRIIVTDNRRLCRECLRLLIETFDPKLTVVEAHDPKEVLSLLKSSDMQSVVMYNLVIPGEEGLDFVGKLHESVPDIPLIVLCDFDDPTIVTGALERGAKAFLPSTTPSPVMVAVLHLVIAGGVYAPPNLLLPGIHSPRAAGRQTSGTLRATLLADLFPELTPRQSAVLSQLSEGKTNRAIAESLNMCENTVKAHVKHVMRKLDVGNRTAAALMADRQVSRVSDAS